MAEIDQRIKKLGIEEAEKDEEEVEVEEDEEAGEVKVNHGRRRTTPKRFVEEQTWTRSIKRKTR